MKAAAYILATINLAIAPVHSFVSCGQSARLGTLSLLLFLATTILASLTPRDTRGSLRPFFLGLFALLPNIMCSH